MVVPLINYREIDLSSRDETWLTNSLYGETRSLFDVEPLVFCEITVEIEIFIKGFQTAAKPS